MVRPHAWDVGALLFDHAKKLVPMDVAEIDIEHILEILQPLWDRGFHQGAHSTLQRIETVLATAIARKWRTNANVASWKVSSMSRLSVPAATTKTVATP